MRLYSALLCALVSAFLSVYCLSEFSSVAPIAFTALVPYFFALSNTQSSRNAVLINSAFSVAVGFGVLHGAETYGLFVYAMAAFALGSQYFLWGSVATWFLRHYGSSIWTALAWAALWVFAESLYCRIPYFASGLVAATLAWDSTWLRLAPWTGSVGIGFFLILASVSIAFFLKEYLEAQRNLPKHSSRYLLLVVITLGILRLPYWLALEPASSPHQLTVAVTQGSITHNQYRNEDQSLPNGETILDRYFRLIENAQQQEIDLVFVPETAFYTPLHVVFEARPAFWQHLRVPVVLGTPYFPEPETKHRTLYNAIATIENNFVVADTYLKHHLVPFAEDIFTPGPKPHPLRVLNTAVATPICFEAIFPEYVRSLIAVGAEAIFVSTDDSGFGASRLSAVVAKQTILRAIENGRGLVRGAQSGPSLFVTPQGGITTQTKAFEQTVVVGTVELHQFKTFYTVHGDYPSLFFASIVLMMCIILSHNRLTSHSPQLP